MKNFIGAALLLYPVLLACNSSQGQTLAEDKVPQAVRSAFTQRFPNATKAKWEMENATTYEVIFRVNGSECSASFDPKGAWMETETEIKEADLPAPVRAMLAKEYAGHKLSEFERVETPADGTAYEVEAELGEKTTEVKLSADGHVLKATVEEQEEGDKEEKD